MNLNLILSGFRTSFIGLILVWLCHPAKADTDPMYYAVQVSAAVQTTPAQITLNWPTDANATGYSLFRKSPADKSWGQGIALPGASVTYTDASVIPGTIYE